MAGAYHDSRVSAIWEAHWEVAMKLENQSDHIALLSLMLVGVLTRRLVEIGQLDNKTAEQIHRLVQGVRIHAKHANLTDLDVLFDNIESHLETRRTSTAPDPLWPAVPHH
jgi:hypothetical protein